MRLVQSLPFGAMFLLAVVPYQSWAHFGGALALWQAHRAVLVGCAALLFATLLLRWIGCSKAKAHVLLGMAVLGLMYVHLNPIVPIVIGSIALLAALIDRARAYENAAITLLVSGAVFFAGAVSPLVLSRSDRQIVELEDQIAPLNAGSEMVLSQTPSIVHVVLDGYGSRDTLQDIYGHDTTPFFSSLEARGFKVLGNVVTPYSQTLPSMASVMSAGSIDLSDDRGHANRLRADLGYTVRHGAVPALLEVSGYNIARSQSGYAPLDFEPMRQLKNNWAKFGMFDAMLLNPYGDYFGETHNALLRAAVAPGSLKDLPQPYFYYQHLIAPHPPFTITADGDTRGKSEFGINDGSHAIQGDPDRRQRYISGYREKARFVETALIRQIDALPNGPKIVILHGDHGPGAFLDHESASKTCHSERLTTFLAVYSDVPGITDRIVSPTEGMFSTANIYRVVFSVLAQQDIPLNASTSRYLPWSDPTDVVNVEAEDLERPCVTTVHAELAK